MKNRKILCKCGDILQIDFDGDFPEGHDAVKIADRELVSHANNCTKEISLKYDTKHAT